MSDMEEVIKVLLKHDMEEVMKIVLQRIKDLEAQIDEAYSVGNAEGYSEGYSDGYSNAMDEVDSRQ